MSRRQRHMQTLEHMLHYRGAIGQLARSLYAEMQQMTDEEYDTQIRRSH
jgi:hypothetical protein